VQFGEAGLSEKEPAWHFEQFPAGEFESTKKPGLQTHVLPVPDD
jgi:hypothetical protein